MLFGLLKREKKPAAAADAILFETGSVPVVLSKEILDAEPERRRNLDAIRNLLAAIPKAEKEIFVDRVIHRFILYVMDLPASEKNHHARPFGLVDHSLEVARLALERSQDLRFITTHDPVVNHAMQPKWVYAVYVAAVLHDIGKMTDVVVTAPDGSTWNPFLEPLAAFYRRHGLEAGDPSRLKHRPGRGLDGHELHKPYFFSAVLPAEARGYLGRIQSHILVEQSEAGAAVKRLWREADQLSAKRDSDLAGLDLPGANRVPGILQHGNRLWHYFCDAFRRAIDERLLALDAIDGDAFAGETMIALTYPAGVLPVLQMLRRVWETRDREIRAYTLDVDGARKLLEQLAFHGSIFQDRESGAWSFDGAIAHGNEVRPPAAAVLFYKDRLAPEVKAGPFEIRFFNRTTGREIAIGDFRKPSATADPAPRDAAAAEAAPADILPPAPPRISSDSDEDLPQEQEAPTDPATSAGAAALPVPPGTPRRQPRPKARPLSDVTEADIGLTADAILQDIRNALRSGILAPNLTGSCEVYLDATHAYIVIPEALNLVAAARHYKIRPANALNAYLNILGGSPLVEHGSNRKVVYPIFTSDGAVREVSTFRVRIAGWLSPHEIADYGMSPKPLVPATPEEKERRLLRRIDS